MKDKKTKTIIIIIISFVVLIAALYLGGALFFASHFFPNTTIGKIDVSMMQKDEAQKTIDDAIDSMHIEIHEKDPETGVDTIILSEDAKTIGVAPATITDVSGILNAQDNFFWFLHLSNNQIGTFVNVNENVFNQCLDGNQNFDNSRRVAAKNAGYAYDEATKTYTVIPEVPGIQIDRNALISELKSNLTGFQSVTLDLSNGDCYIQPSIKTNSPDVQKPLALLNTYANSVIVYNIAGTEAAETLDVSTFHNWFSLDTNDLITFDHEQMAQYYKTLGEKYNTNPETGTGWKIDEELEIENVKPNILEGSRIQRDITYTTTPENINNN